MNNKQHADLAYLIKLLHLQLDKHFSRIYNGFHVRNNSQQQGLSLDTTFELQPFDSSFCCVLFELRCIMSSIVDSCPAKFSMLLASQALNYMVSMHKLSVALGIVLVCEHQT